MSHDKAACPLCIRLAAGQTHLMNGNIEISPLCEACQKHHYERYPCAVEEKLPKSRCPRCRVNRRALVDIPQSARWERKTYAPMCHQCLLLDGWHQITHIVLLKDGPYEATWYEKPPAVDPISDDDLFALMGRSVASQRSSR